MDQNRNENWQDLCKAAANELDPKKLMDLITELNRALDKRDGQRTASAGPIDDGALSTESAV
jgi:hypothetical protein